MSKPLDFNDVGRIPAPGDNVAIAVRTIAAGSTVLFEGKPLSIPFTVLEGHRFAPFAIAVDEPLLSWGLPFGLATRPIAPGDYVCNPTILAALKQRHVTFPIPETPNFKDHFALYKLDETGFKPGHQVARYPETRTFNGFARGGGRGVGTRNFIAILGTTSLTASYARLLAQRFQNISQTCPNIDGVVAIAHTEGGTGHKPNNLDLLLRTLAGFIVNPNVAAVLAVDLGTEAVTNQMLQEYLTKYQYPIASMPHQFLSIRENLQAALAEGERVVREWLPVVNGITRTPQSLEHLKIGMQCGGSDAFSGVSGNPLVGCITRELVRYGGSANLAETDELIGAEPYVLANVRDLETARAFLRTLNRFETLVGWHGLSAQSNPSGGNIFRGLYNIAIKSIGAARKKDPSVRLDYVIDYSQRMTQPGFYFMDSPGNDLESVAGQVAAGCNMIVFSTGNGSITNHPYVPTIKLMTNTGRFNLLPNEMDINAGRYLDGTPLETLGQEAFDYTIKIASGQLSAGERAGHAQVQIWREWRQTDARRLQYFKHQPRPRGEPVPLPERGSQPAGWHFRGLQTNNDFVTDQIGLIVPTSLCAGQIGNLIAARLNEEMRKNPSAAHHGVSRYVALPHTEGCGVSGDEAQELLQRTMIGYLCHPIVKRGLMLEHGCEKTHNDAMRNFLADHGIDSSRFGWASIQLDGGMEKVTNKVMNWFHQELARESDTPEKDVSLKHLRLGLTSTAPVDAPIATACAQILLTVARAGGIAVIPQNSPLLQSKEFAGALHASMSWQPTIAYGESVLKPGFHIMEAPTEHMVETMTGLGATGVEVILALVDKSAIQAHPMIPLIQASIGRELADVDQVLHPEKQSAGTITDQLSDLIMRVASRQYTPKLLAQGSTDFQMTRGWLGVST